MYKTIQTDTMIEDEFSEKNKHDLFMFDFFLAIFTCGIGIVVGLLLRVYTGVSLRERLKL